MKTEASPTRKEIRDTRRGVSLEDGSIRVDSDSCATSSNPNSEMRPTSIIIGDTADGATGDAQPSRGTAPSHNGLRCCIDIYNPRPGTCDSTVDTDDRQVVSDFFGRNKSATTNIPEDYYLCLCRKHYQQPEYRNEEAQNAKMRCVAIVYTIRRMMQDGRWAGFELQLSKQEHDRIVHGKDVAGEARKYNEKLAKDKETKADEAHRKHKKKVPNAVPGWIYEKWLLKDPFHDTYHSFSGREGVRYNGDQLIEIVTRICHDCVTREVGMPAIEAVPITWGQVCAWERQQAKKVRTAANARIKSAKRQGKRSSSKDEARVARIEKENALKQADKAELALQKSILAANATAHTLPGKRPSRRSSEKLNAASLEGDDDDNEDEGSLKDHESAKDNTPLTSRFSTRNPTPVTPFATEPTMVRSSTRSSLRRKRAAAEEVITFPESPSKRTRVSSRPVRA